MDRSCVRSWSRRRRVSSSRRGDVCSLLARRTLADESTNDFLILRRFIGIDNRLAPASPSRPPPGHCPPRETARFEASADAMALEARLWSYNSKTLMGAFPGPRR